MSAASQRLRRCDRLRDRRDFQRASRDGHRANTRNFVLLATPRRSSGVGARLGVTASRRVGGAVVRNRVKRCVREWFRRSGRDAARGMDLVVIARPAVAALGQGEIQRELELGASRLGASGEAR